MNERGCRHPLRRRPQTPVTMRNEAPFTLTRLHRARAHLSPPVTLASHKACRVEQCTGLCEAEGLKVLAVKKTTNSSSVVKVTSVKQSVNGESSRERGGGVGDRAWAGQAAADAWGEMAMMRTDTSHMRPPDNAGVPCGMSSSLLMHARTHTHTHTHTGTCINQACTQEHANLTLEQWVWQIRGLHFKNVAHECWT